VQKNREKRKKKDSISLTKEDHPSSNVYNVYFIKENVMGDKIEQKAGGDITGDNIIKGEKKGNIIVNKSSTAENFGNTILMVAAAVVGIGAILGILTGRISEETGYIIIAIAFGGDLILYKLRKKQ
jgi:hypothetical protein